MLIQVKGKEFGISLNVCKEHTYRDVVTRRMSGAYAIAILHSNTDFIFDVVAAKEEVKHLKMIDPFIIFNNVSNKNISLSLLLIFSGYFLYAQDIEDKSITEQIWLDYNPSYKLNEKVDVYGGIGARTVFPNEWYRFVVGPSVRYRKPKLILNKLYYAEEIHFGIKFFFTVNKGFSNRFEIRPFQGYKLSWPNRPLIILQHYVRLEERFDIETSDWINTFGLRLRYEAKLTLKFKGDWIPFNKRLFLPISMEVFGNLKGAQQFNDLVRISPGIGYEFSPTWKAELLFSYHYTRDTVEDDFDTNDFVFPTNRMRATLH